MVKKILFLSSLTIVLNGCSQPTNDKTERTSEDALTDSIHEFSSSFDHGQLWVGDNVLVYDLHISRSCNDECAHDHGQPDKRACKHGRPLAFVILDSIWQARQGGVAEPDADKRTSSTE